MVRFEEEMMFHRMEIKSKPVNVARIYKVIEVIGTPGVVSNMETFLAPSSDGNSEAVLTNAILVFMEQKVKKCI